MPKDTFFNLAEEKRNRIISAAISEFAANQYEVASISKIVKQASIAKGSFYQYFEDKKDLYFYIIEVASQKKKAYLSPKFSDINSNFFTFLHLVIFFLRYVSKLNFSTFFF